LADSGLRETFRSWPGGRTIPQRSARLPPQPSRTAVAPPRRVGREAKAKGGRSGTFPNGASRAGRDVLRSFPGEAGVPKEPKRRRTGGEETGNRPRLRTGGKPPGRIPIRPGRFRRIPGEGLVPCLGEPKGRRGFGRSVPMGEEGGASPLRTHPGSGGALRFATTPGDGEGGGLSGRHPTRSGSGRASVRPRPSGPERGRKAPLRAPPTQRVIAPAAAIVSLGHEGAGPRAGPPFLGTVTRDCPTSRLLDSH
jgi:hypothetical protein